MVKKKAKPLKPAKKKGSSWKKEDVEVHTGLPPKVEGQLRCFCRLSVSQILWLSPSPPDVTFVSVKWWGEDGEGAIFRPIDIKKANKASAKTVARYPIRSGPKQFSSYLKDMGSLMLEILSGAMMVPVGYAEVSQVDLLSPNNPINGFFPVMSPNEDKIAELHVSLTLETVTESYDSLGDSIPTTDISMDTQATQESNLYPQKHQPIPHSMAPRKPVDDPFISPASRQNGDVRMQNGYAESAEDLRQQLNYSFYDNQERRHLPSVKSGDTVAITANGGVVTAKSSKGYSPSRHQASPGKRQHIQAGREDMQRRSPSRRQFTSTEHTHINHHTSPKRRDQHTAPHALSPVRSSEENTGTAGSDLLSILLDRGDKLRKQMIISSLDDTAGATEKREGATLRTDGTSNLNVSSLSERRGSTGSLFKEILKSDKAHDIGNMTATNLDDKALDLVFGGDGMYDYQMMKMMGGSPSSSISGDIDLASDPGDPVHNESLLKELFYKNMDSEVSGLSDLSGDDEIIKKSQAAAARAPARQASPAPSIEDPANARPPSRRSSVSSITLPIPEPEELEEAKPKKRSRTPKRRARLKTRRKGSKKRRKSRGSASECSDSDVTSTPRSEGSMVSFDMPPSDIDEPEEEVRGKRNKVDGLSVERLTLLGRVHVARVVIEHLKLYGQEQNVTPTKKRMKGKFVGKPPKPATKAKKPVTYFIEYQFPVVATSRDKYSPNAMATEVMRVASKNVKDGVVTFGHRSVFPIMFDGTAVDKWWKSALIFKLFSRTAGQKTPTQVGSCGVPLKSILKSDLLHLEKTIEIRENVVNRSLNSSVRSLDSDGLFGSLKVSIKLASDSRDFSSALANTKLAEMSGKAKIVPIPKPAPTSSKPPIPQDHPSAINTQAPVLNLQRIQRETETQMANDIITEVDQMVNRSQGANRAMSSGQQREYHQGVQHMSLSHAQNLSPEVMTLHTMLFIPDGHGITLNGIPCLSSVKRHPVFPHQGADASSRENNARNTYLVCRMFWCDDAVHSNVCWGTSNPEYSFIQIAPVLVSQSLLERMRNNFMIVEVWDKKTTAENDKLIGIVKLSLHQFFMSFRDKKISDALMKSQYPVISVDNYLPIVDPLSGSHYGQLKVLLAMGSADQVSSLQRLKLEGNTVPERPSHHLDNGSKQRGEKLSLKHFGGDTIIEHIFEIVVEGIRGLAMFENMMWGEADCFVQYYFPTQTQSEIPGAPVIKHAVPTMKSFRSATTLCIPDPVLNDVNRHRLTLSQGIPVQRELLTACAASGCGGSGGIPFEVWCRYYHPNVRDQCIAKSTLPLAKLCAMVTMQKRGESSVQTFSLPLTQVLTDLDEIDPEVKAKRKESGLMNVTVHYKTQIVQMEASNAAHKNLGNSQVCISVGVIRASGLKVAAESIAKQDQGMQYPAEVGVNAYVKVKMSFLGKDDVRITRTIARSFVPEFSHTMDFPCSLLWTEADNEAMSLGEVLERGEVTMEIWHQVPGLATDMDRQLLEVSENDAAKGHVVGKTHDVLLGTTTLPLSTLLSHRTGINGWFPVNQPPMQHSDQNDTSDHHGNRLTRVVGGLELSIKFAHHTDRERVLHASRGVGWSPVDLNIEEDEEWQSDDESTNRYHRITVLVDQANFPLLNCLLTGQSSLDKSARCYVRYKFYDKGAVISKLTKMAESDGYMTTELGHRHKFQIPASSPFRWYLREERLEVQVWVSYNGKHGLNQKPHNRDKLIGTAFINMETLGDQRRKQHRVSGIYPLFKPGAASLGGAYIRAHVSCKPQFGTQHEDKSTRNVSDVSVEADQEYDPNDSFHQLTRHERSAKYSSTDSSLYRVEEDVRASFAVIISIERAMHLPHVCDKKGPGEQFPNTYVSYQTAESTSPVCSSVFPRSDCPVWDHQHETKLSTELLFEENKNLVLKVWHKPNDSSKQPDKSSDRVLGFVSVDLTPLASGLQQICGWYNIVDFNGQCKGQIKVNIIPQECMVQYKQSVPGCVPSGQQPSSLPIGVNSSFHNPPLWFPEQPVSLPINSQPFTSSLPHFHQHLQNVKDHHEMLQNKLAQNIKQFLNQQEQQLNSESQERGDNPSVQPEPSIHWIPSNINFDDGNGSSRSILFTSLRKQMQDLDDITSKLKQKLFVSPNQQVPQPDVPVTLSHVVQSEVEAPVTCRSGHATLTSTHSGLSTISSLHLMQTQQESARTHESELLLTGSHENESSHTAVDSGAFSVTHSSEKYQEPLDSQRTSSDKLDTFPLGVTPRELLGHLKADNTPREQNNSDTGVLCDYTPREDDGTSVSNTDPSPRDLPSQEATPRGMGSKDLNSARFSDPSSLGFLYQGEMSHRSQNSSNGMRINGNGQTNEVHGDGSNEMAQKDMSTIHENPENEESDWEGDEKYYHQYRDILDEQENCEEESDNENSDADVVVPRTLNDISGKFGGIPGMSGHITPRDPKHWDYKDSPREFHQSDNTMPFDVASDSRSKSRSNTSSRKTSSGDISTLEGTPKKERLEIVGNEKETHYIEKDSWFSDGEMDGEKSSYEPSYGHVGRSHVSTTQEEGEDSKYNVEQDSWFSEGDNIRSSIQSSRSIEERGQINSRHLLSGVRLDTITSVGSKEFDSFYQEQVFVNNLREYIEVTNTQNYHSVENGQKSCDSSYHDDRSGSVRSVQNGFTDDPEDQEVTNSSKEKFKVVVNELEDFFTTPDGQRHVRNNTDSKSLSSTNSSTKSESYVKDNVNGLHEIQTDSVNLQSQPELGAGDFNAKVIQTTNVNHEDCLSDSDEESTMKTNTLQNGGNSDVPNFFLPMQHMHESMKALQLATNGCSGSSPMGVEESEERSHGKALAASEMMHKLRRNDAKNRFSHISTKGRQLPTAEETKRIAKIFSSKMS